MHHDTIIQILRDFEESVRVARPGMQPQLFQVVEWRGDDQEYSVITYGGEMLSLDVCQHVGRATLKQMEATGRILVTETGVGGTFQFGLVPSPPQQGNTSTGDVVGNGIAIGSGAEVNNITNVTVHLTERHLSQSS